MKLLIATRNRGKVSEIRALLGEQALKNVQVITLVDLPNLGEPREEGSTFQENARLKALHYAQAHKVLCVADDSGLSVEALKGRPGVMSARYAGPNATDRENNTLLIDDLKPYQRPWKASFLCAAVAALPGRVIAVTEARINGEIIPVPRGSEGFGYDPIFRVEGTANTMAELSVEEKNRISHRGKAMRTLIGELKQSGMFG